MKTKGLPADSTIESVQHLIGDLDKYVSGVFGNAHTTQRAAQYAPVQVRIGIEGTGSGPNYRVETLDDAGALVGLPKTFRSDNHKKLFDDNDGLIEGNWSTQAMSYEQIRNLHSTIRNFKQKL